MYKFKQKGMTLIEVLVALIILSTGILGAVAMQATVKKNSFDAMQRSKASALAQDIIERMRVNDPDQLAEYENIAPTSAPTSCNSTGSNCNPAQLAAEDLFEWQQALNGSDVKDSGSNSVGGLVGATGCIAVTADTAFNKATKNTIKVVISWQGRTVISDAKATTGSDCGTSGNKRRQLVVNALII